MEKGDEVAQKTNLWPQHCDAHKSYLAMEEFFNQTSSEGSLLIQQILASEHAYSLY
jgi:hypothetical protein